MKSYQIHEMKLNQYDKIALVSAVVDAARLRQFARSLVTHTQKCDLQNLSLACIFLVPFFLGGPSLINVGLVLFFVM